MADTYECSNCHQTFEKGWSDEEASAEYAGKFPTLTVEDAAIVCDDCYNKIMGWADTLPESERLHLTSPDQTKPT